MTPLTILLIIVVIVLIFFILKYIFSSSNTLDGNLRNGQAVTKIDGKNLPGGGLSTNYAFSTWFYVNDWTYKYGNPKIIFARSNKNNNEPTAAGIQTSDPSPCVALGNTENTIHVYVKCFPPTTTSPTNIPDDIMVTNIPIQKWVNLSISINEKTLDVYLDGKLVKTQILSGTAQVSQNDLYLTHDGGFDGWTSKFLYFEKPMNPQQAQNIYADGPTGWMSNLSTYQIQLSLIENGTPQSSVTI